MKSELILDFALTVRCLWGILKGDKRDTGRAEGAAWSLPFPSLPFPSLPFPSLSFCDRRTGDHVKFCEHSKSVRDRVVLGRGDGRRVSLDQAVHRGGGAADAGDGRRAKVRVSVGVFLRREYSLPMP
ncbi:MAG: hypothetical protein L6Q93_11785 [Phycisphaerae bacterium]|nr:hypothetical protein [Phycisphaerae bacterium]NUQ08891.1 hypothetical protein [Phycisphaerae bacterium]